MQASTQNYRSVLVPLDGSELAENALLPAIRIAHRHGETLHVVHVYVPWVGIHGEYAVRYDEAMHRALKSQAKEYLDAVVARVQGFDDVRVS